MLKAERSRNERFRYHLFDRIDCIGDISDMQGGGVMGRLIDADKLILSLNDFMLVESPTDNASTGERRMSEMVCKIIQHCIEVAEEQPTAYDVEKVVEQLEEQERFYETSSDCDSLELPQNAYYKGMVKGFTYSRNIVRKGGVE